MSEEYAPSLFGYRCCRCSVAGKLEAFRVMSYVSGGVKTRTPNLNERLYGFPTKDRGWPVVDRAALNRKEFDRLLLDF
jgi:hypothetical protein